MFIINDFVAIDERLHSMFHIKCHSKGYIVRQISEKLEMSCKSVYYTLPRKRESGAENDKKKLHSERQQKKCNRLLTVSQIIAALN